MTNRFQRRKPIPGPKEHWLKGSLQAFTSDPLRFLSNQAETFGPVSSFRFGPFQEVYFVNDPDLIKEILVTKQKAFIKSRDIQMLKAVVGEGLLTNEKESHLKQRRLIQPAFKKTHIHQYAQDMIETTNAFIKDWKDEEERNIAADMMNIALGIITKTMFGMEVGQGADVIEQPMEAVMKLGIKRMRSLSPLPLWVPTQANRQLKKAVKELDDVLFSIISKRRLEDNQSEDLLGMLMKARDEENGAVMSDQQLRDELMTIFLAGHETTANLLAWTLYLLSEHPSADERLYAEIKEVTNGEALLPEHYTKLTYTQNVISESMRLYPPAYVIGRQVEEDIEIGPYLFNKGAMVLISQYVMHRNASFYHEPNIFKPERFDYNFLKTLPPFAYFPFGGGPRVCIGNHFAMMEATLALAAIAQNYKFTLTSSQQKVTPQPLITLRPKGGLMMKVEKRK
ncbi:cytochrome P450 [Alkalihalophilus pseudofirmus]|uniref:Cytochrome P450 n=1 Tax=Alkalihalophilus pseudofirmus TaxID=79885 RepID=A0AAJ2U485_ALKPS|nr:cytochrome P450 [Alkalihalophilus pseudofirmus]MDV2886995.1 cytochrome P450 [Alkalihalophilus pseudofirmus]